MKKLLFFFFTITISVMFTSCQFTVGGDSADKASSIHNYDCQFVLQTPVGYDNKMGIGLTGQVYFEKNKPSTETLWMSKSLYNKLIKGQDSLKIQIYKAKCVWCKGSELKMCYFVSYVE